MEEILLALTCAHVSEYSELWISLMSFTLSTHTPVNPAAQTHWYALTLSTHVPPFTHGYDAHSFTSTSQCEPAKPATHVQVYCTTQAAFVHLPSVHVAPFMQGAEEHSATAEQIKQPFLVSYPGWQTHSCFFTPTWIHSASFGSQLFSLVEHLSTSVVQSAPAHESAHVHVKPFTASVHVAPFEHGDDKHSLSFVAQFLPLQPFAQMHT